MQSIYLRFRINKYLANCTNGEIENCDKVERILISSRQILKTPKNKNIKILEDINDGNYFCGEFNESGKLDGYGFAIYKTGSIEQGQFKNGKLVKDHRYFTLYPEKKYPIFGKQKNDDLQGYYCGFKKSGLIVEGYIKNGKYCGERFTKNYRGSHIFENWSGEKVKY